MIAEAKLLTCLDEAFIFYLFKYWICYRNRKQQRSSLGTLWCTLYLRKARIAEQKEFCKDGDLINECLSFNAILFVQSLIWRKQSLTFSCCFRKRPLPSSKLFTAQRASAAVFADVSRLDSVIVLPQLSISYMSAAALWRYCYPVFQVRVN